MESDFWTSSSKIRKSREDAHYRRLYTNEVSDKCIKHIISTSIWVQINRRGYYGATNSRKFFQCLTFKLESFSSQFSFQSWYKSRFEESQYPAYTLQSCLFTVASYTVIPCVLLKHNLGIRRQQKDDLPEAIVTRFLKKQEELQLLCKIEYPRTYFQETVERLDLHMFRAGSQYVFSVVASLRGKLVNKRTDTNKLPFLIGGAQVAL